MDGETAAADGRAATNPLCNDTKLKLGTFSSNLSGGCTVSAADGVLEMNWPNTRKLAELADDMEFEALVPVGRWKGFGGETNFNGDGFECYTWAAGMSPINQNSSIFATSHVPTVHPCMAAKQGMTIDHISSGRFTLNIVCGWFKPEIEMFGAPILEHDRRYKMAAEWIEIITRLWTAEEEFDYEGEYFQVSNAICGPLPVQRPHPAIMSAGTSDVGRAFAAKYADVAFISHQGRKPEEMSEVVDSYRQAAWDDHRRKISVWTTSYVYQGDTESDARALYKHVVHENGDVAAVDNLLGVMGVDKAHIPPERLKIMHEHVMAGWGGFPLIGTAAQIVDGLQAISGMGFDGTLVSFPRYIDGMTRFRDETYPLLKQTPLRC